MELRLLWHNMKKFPEDLPLNGMRRNDVQPKIEAGNQKIKR